MRSPSNRLPTVLEVRCVGLQVRNSSVQLTEDSLFEQNSELRGNTCRAVTFDPPVQRRSAHYRGICHESEVLMKNLKPSDDDMVFSWREVSGWSHIHGGFIAYRSVLKPSEAKTDAPGLVVPLKIKSEPGTANHERIRRPGAEGRQECPVAQVFDVKTSLLRPEGHFS